MQKYIDEYTLLAEAKMMYQDCHESYILVEGKTDKIQVKASTTGLVSQILVHLDGPDGEVVAEIQIGKSKGNYDFAEYEKRLLNNQ